jgi:DNA-directed RNA polymerase specialized sigma24 family protein
LSHRLGFDGHRYDEMKGKELTEEDRDWLAERFEEHRTHLRAVGYRMLGSLSEADDAVQEAWLRLSRSDTREIENLGGWLTTVVARVCLNMLQARKVRREEPLDVHVPDPIVSLDDETDPEQQALLADSVGLALLVVLPSTRSLRSWGARRRRPGSSPAAPAGACKARPPLPILTSTASVKWSTPSSPPPARATSRR